MMKIYVLILPMVLATIGFVHADDALKSINGTQADLVPFTLPDRDLRGKITDSLSGEPLSGVTISVKGSTIGTVSDAEGNYALRVTDGATIIVSFVGFKTQELTVGEKSVINVELSSLVSELDQLVVIGYGSVKKRDLTGSVASVNAAEIASIPTTTLTESLQGKVAGLVVTNASSSPGSGANVLIRGKRSVIASNDPLYVVDGMPITGGIEELSPLDIESMEVLKDASATAIYGSRGANGVILITTKSGKAGKTVVEYNGYVGPQTILNELDIWGAADYAEITREAYRTTSNVAQIYHSPTPSRQEDLLNPAFRRDTAMMTNVMRGWVDENTYDPSLLENQSDIRPYVTRTGLLSNHQLSIHGGNESTQFLISGTYNKNDGIYKDESYERYSIRSNLSHDISKNVKIIANSQYTHSLQERGTGFAGKLRLPPIGALFDNNGNLIALPGNEIDYNPLFDLEPGAVVHPKKVTHFLGNYAVDINLPIEGLNFRSNLGLDSRTVQDYDFRSARTSSRQLGTSLAKNEGRKFTMFSLENIVSYNKDIDANNRLDVTFVQSLQQDQREDYSIEVEDLPADNLVFYDLGAALRLNNRSSSMVKWKMSSFMGRVNYSLLNKYLVTISARYDGSSRLAQGHKWVLFPSAAIAWQVKEEQFLKDAHWLNNLKLRLGFGRTGNSSIDPYQTKGLLKQMTYSFNNGDINTIGFAPDVMINSSLTWETTNQYNLGIDFGILEGRLNGTIDLYLQNTKDLLLNRQLPIVSGFSDILTNIGKTRNRGIEISLNSINIDQGDFKWTSYLNAYSDREEFVELYDGKREDIGNAWFIGQPIDVFYDYKKLGIWQDTPEDHEAMKKFNDNGANFKPGDIKIKDNNDDNKITDADKQIIGNPRPTVVMSMGNTFNYKNFDLSFYLYSSLGTMLYNDIAVEEHIGRNGGAKFDYWTPTNPTNAFPRPNVDEERPLYITSAYYDKADFLRMRSLTLGYSLPQTILKSIFIENLRLYFTAKDPFIITNYSGVDPESTKNGGYLAPSVRSWIFGVDIKF